MDLGNLVNRSILPALNRCAVCGSRKSNVAGHPSKQRQKPLTITLNPTRYFPSGTAGTLHDAG
jgi:hypothetical protein